MAYSRWSTDNFQCDLYVYAHVGGFWSINVAERRYDAPMSEIENEQPEDVTVEDAAAYMRWLGSRMTKIELPYAGATFSIADAEEAAQKIEELMALGYRAPADLPDLIREDADTFDEPVGDTL